MVARRVRSRRGGASFWETITPVPRLTVGVAGHIGDVDESR